MSGGTTCTAFLTIASRVVAKIIPTTNTKIMIVDIELVTINMASLWVLPLIGPIVRGVRYATIKQIRA